MEFKSAVSQDGLMQSLIYKEGSLPIPVPPNENSKFADIQRPSMSQTSSSGIWDSTSASGTTSGLQSNMFKGRGQDSLNSYSTFFRSHNSSSIWNYNENSSYVSPFFPQENTLLPDLLSNVSPNDVSSEESEVEYNYSEDPDFRPHANWILKILED